MGSVGSTNTRAEKFIDESEYILICIQSDINEATANENERQLNILVNELKATTHRLKRYLKCKHLNENTSQRCQALLFKYELILSEIFSLSSNKSSTTSEDSNKISDKLYEEPEYICMASTPTEPIYANAEDDKIVTIPDKILEITSKIPLPRPRDTLSDSSNNDINDTAEVDDIYEVPRDLFAKVSKLHPLPNNKEATPVAPITVYSPTPSTNDISVDGIPACLSILDDILDKEDNDVGDITKSNVDACFKPPNHPSNFPSYVEEIKYFWYNKNKNGIEKTPCNKLDKTRDNDDAVYAIPRRFSTFSGITNKEKEDTEETYTITHLPLPNNLEKEGVAANEFSKYYTEFSDMWEQAYIEIDEAKEILSEHVIHISEAHLPGNIDDTALSECEDSEEIYINYPAKTDDLKAISISDKAKITKLPIPTPRDKEVIVNEIPNYFSKLNNILDKTDVNFDDAREAFHIKKKCNEAKSMFNKKVMQIVRKSEEQIVYA